MDKWVVERLQSWLKLARENPLAIRLRACDEPIRARQKGEEDWVVFLVLVKVPYFLKQPERSVNDTRKDIVG